jgi:alkane 1-monooxygenase
MNKLIINLRYFLTPAFIVLAMLGIVYGGIFAWLGVAMFGLAVVIDWMTSILPMKLEPAGVDENGELNGIPWLLNTMMYAQYPIFVLLQLSLVWRVSEYVAGVPLGTTEILGVTVNQGITGVNLIGSCHF